MKVKANSHHVFNLRAFDHFTNMVHICIHSKTVQTWTQVDEKTLISFTSELKSPFWSKSYVLQYFGSMFKIRPKLAELICELVLYVLLHFFFINLDEY